MGRQLRGIYGVALGFAASSATVGVIGLWLALWLVPDIKPKLT